MNFDRILSKTVDYEKIAKFWYLVALLGLIPVILTFFIGFAPEGTDDKAWLRLPGNLTFQPSELLKIAFVITFSTPFAFANSETIIFSSSTPVSETSASHVKSPSSINASKLIKYGLDGKYIGEMDFPSNGLSSSSYPLLLDNSAWVHLGQSFGGDGNFQLYYTSGNGVKTDSILVRDGESTALNPSEIMNISVFKGKGSMAGFGLMGCNGLIYINMKNDKTMLIPSFYPSLWSMDDQIRFREPYNDTIFSLKDNVLDIVVKDRGVGIPDVETARRPAFTTGGADRSPDQGGRRSVEHLYGSPGKTVRSTRTVF